MNHTLNRPLPPGGREALEERLARRLAAHLAERADLVSPDISERLRVGREQALERARSARQAQAASAPQISLSATGAASLGGGDDGIGRWWLRLGTLLPAVLLAAGLLVIDRLHERSQIAAAAEVDAELLADDLPPGAYSDAGFAEFLKAPRD